MFRLAVVVGVLLALCWATVVRAQNEEDALKRIQAMRDAAVKLEARGELAAAIEGMHRVHEECVKHFGAESVEARSVLTALEPWKAELNHQKDDPNGYAAWKAQATQRADLVAAGCFREYAEQHLNRDRSAEAYLPAEGIACLLPSLNDVRAVIILGDIDQAEKLCAELWQALKEKGQQQALYGRMALLRMMQIALERGDFERFQQLVEQTESWKNDATTLDYIQPYPIATLGLRLEYHLLVGDLDAADRTLLAMRDAIQAFDGNFSAYYHLLVGLRHIQKDLPQDALQRFSQCLGAPTTPDFLDVNQLWRIRAACEVARYLCENQDVETGMDLMRAIQSDFEKKFSPKSLPFDVFDGCLSTIALAEGRTDDALKLAVSATKIAEEKYGPKNYIVAKQLLRQGEALCAKQDFAQAKPLFDRAKEIALAQLGEKAPLVKEIHEAAKIIEVHSLFEVQAKPVAPSFNSAK